MSASPTAVITSPGWSPASAAGLLDSTSPTTMPRCRPAASFGDAMPIHVLSALQAANSLTATAATLLMGMANPMPCAGADSHVDADHVAVDVQKRSARIAGIDAGVGLDKVVVELGVAHLDRAMQRADNAAGHRMFIAVGVADRDDGFARHQIGRGANGNHGQRIPRFDFDDGQIGIQIAGDQLGHVAAAVGQGDDDLADALDNVMVGDDVSARVDHHAGAHAVDLAADLGRGRLSGDGRGGDGFFAADIHHRPANALNRLDDGRLPQLGGIRAGRQQQATTNRKKDRPGAAALTRNGVRGSMGHGMSVADVVLPWCGKQRNLLRGPQKAFAVQAAVHP